MRIGIAFLIGHLLLFSNPYKLKPNSMTLSTPTHYHHYYSLSSASLPWSTAAGGIDPHSSSSSSSSLFLFLVLIKAMGSTIVGSWEAMQDDSAICLQDLECPITHVHNYPSPHRTLTHTPHGANKSQSPSYVHP